MLRTIQGRLILMVLPAIIILVAVMYIANRNSSEMLKIGKGALIQAIADRSASSINGELTQISKTFAGWSRPDAYGDTIDLAIQFDSVSELGEKFEELVQSEPAVGLITLTNPQGQLLIASDENLTIESVLPDHEAVISQAQQDTKTFAVELIQTNLPPGIPTNKPMFFAGS